MQNNLLTIEEIISRTKKSGTFLGHGDPKVHLAYLTKIRLLPQTIRRKVNNKIVGCYPESVPSLLQKIENLRSSGLTYSQIRFQLSNGQVVQTPAFSFRSVTNELAPIKNYSNGLAFLMIGLILGFLLAHNNSGGLVSTAKAATVTNLPTDATSQSIIKVVNGDNSSSDPIYLIAIPQQNLYKLGKTDINSLK